MATDISALRGGLAACLGETSTKEGRLWPILAFVLIPFFWDRDRRLCRQQPSLDHEERAKTPALTGTCLAWQGSLCPLQRDWICVATYPVNHTSASQGTWPDTPVIRIHLLPFDKGRGGGPREPSVLCCARSQPAKGSCSSRDLPIGAELSPGSCLSPCCHFHFPLVVQYEGDFKNQVPVLFKDKN